VLTATGFVIVNGRGQCLTPQKPRGPHPKKTVASDYVGDPYGCVKFGANPSTGGSGQMGEIGQKFYLFIYLFSYTFFTKSLAGQTRRRIFTVDGSNYAGSRKDVAFGGFLLLLFRFFWGGDYPQTPNFGRRK